MYICYGDNVGEIIGHFSLGCVDIIRVTAESKRINPDISPNSVHRAGRSARGLGAADLAGSPAPGGRYLRWSNQLIGDGKR